MQIDPRGGRFVASITAVVLALVLLGAPATWAVVLLAAQAAHFAVGALRGVQHTPGALLYKFLIRPRLAPPSYLEDAAPPRFAQAVGLAFAVLGLAGYLSGATLLGAIATGFALVAAVLNAAIGLCLGCRLYGVCRIAPVTRNTNNKKEVTA